MPLSLLVSLGEREVAFSYMSRLALRNGVELADLAASLGLRVVSVTQGKVDALDSLARQGGFASEALRAWTPVHASRTTYHFRGLELDRLAFQRRPMRGCPVCLREDGEASDEPGAGMVFRGHWLVQHVTLCLRHRHPLVDLWTERHPVSRFDCARQFAELAPSLRAGKLDVPLREASAFDHWLDDRLATGRRALWLDQFDLHAACRFCELLGDRIAHAQAPYLLWRRHLRRAAIYDLGFRAAADGEPGLRAVFDALLRQTAGPRPTPGQVFGKLYTDLAVTMKGPETAGFRVLIWRYIDERMPWFTSQVQARVAAEGLNGPAREPEMPPRG